MHLINNFFETLEVECEACCHDCNHNRCICQPSSASSESSYIITYSDNEEDDIHFDSLPTPPPANSLPLPSWAEDSNQIDWNNPELTLDVACISQNLNISNNDDGSTAEQRLEARLFQRRWPPTQEELSRRHIWLSLSQAPVREELGLIDRLSSQGFGLMTSSADSGIREGNPSTNISWEDNFGNINPISWETCPGSSTSALTSGNLYGAIGEPVPKKDSQDSINKELMTLSSTDEISDPGFQDNFVFPDPPDGFSFVSFLNF